MHEHRYDERIETLRPAASRIDQDVSAHTGKAAASGRTDALGAEEILGLQRSIGNAGVSSMLEEERSPVHDVISSGGRPLEPDVTHRHGSPDGSRLQRRPGARRLGGGRFGVGGERTRVHRRVQHRLPARHLQPRLQRGPDDAGPRADARGAAAQRAGRRDLGARRDQGQRPVRPLRAGGGVQRRAGDVRPCAGADPEYDRSRRPARGRGGGRAPGTLRPASRRPRPDEESVQGLFVQREGETPEEEEEPVQGLFVQREGAEEEEEMPA